MSQQLLVKHLGDLKCSVHDLELMGLNFGRVELWV